MLKAILLLFLDVLPTIEALSKSGIASNNPNKIPKPPPPHPSDDRVLSPEFYKSVYKNIDEDHQFANTNESNNDDHRATTTRIGGGGRTPWDIGNGRPQPAIVRAYQEGKIRGHVLDAGCGAGENCIYLADKYGIDSVQGFDLSEDACDLAAETVEGIVRGRKLDGQSRSLPFWTTPRFLSASCTDVADRHGEELLSGIVASGNNDKIIETNDGDKSPSLFDVVIDSGLLHCLSKEDAKEYVDQISKLLRPDTGRFYIGCFSTANPDPWDNPRRISEEYLRDELFANGGAMKWEVVSCRDCWWARPPTRGSSTGGAFSLALWVEVRLLGVR